jgi:hypothetical protein
MRITIIRDDELVGIDGEFKRIDMGTLPAGVRAVQWNGSSGHVEYDNGSNTELDSISTFQSFIDAWNDPAPLPETPAPAPEEMIAAAHARISWAYEAAVYAMTAGYPANEVASWPKQEREARAWLDDNNAATPWIDAAYPVRGITKSELVNKIISQADALAPLHGALTGKRQLLRDQINALGENPSQAELDAIQW